MELKNYPQVKDIVTKINDLKDKLYFLDDNMFIRVHNKKSETITTIGINNEHPDTEIASIVQKMLKEKYEARIAELTEQLKGL